MGTSSVGPAPPLPPHFKLLPPLGHGAAQTGLSFKRTFLIFLGGIFLKVLVSPKVLGSSWAWGELRLSAQHGGIGTCGSC